MFERGVERTNRNAFYVGCLGWALAESGETDRARGLLEEVQASFEPGSTIASEAFLLASLGQTDEAFAVMERAREEKQTLILLTGMTWFDRLRDDSRFGDFLSSVGLA